MLRRQRIKQIRRRREDRQQNRKLIERQPLPVRFGLLLELLLGWLLLLGKLLLDASCFPAPPGPFETSMP